MIRTDGIVRRAARLPLHPFLLSTTFCLSLWLSNAAQLYLVDVVATMAVLLGVQTTIWLAIWWPRREGALAAMMTTYLTFIVFYLPTFLSALGLGYLFTGAGAAAAMAGLVPVYARLRRPDIDLPRLTAQHNVILAPIWVLFVGGVVNALVGSPNVDTANVFPPLPAPQRAAEAPDVWHLVFDRYGDADTLRRVYRFDNRPFLDALRARDFDVVAGAAANYQRTAHSLASTFSLDYLDDLADRMGQGASDWKPLYRLLTVNRTMATFRRAGYRIHHFGSWWEPTRRNPSADQTHGFRDLPQIARLALNRSLVGHMLRGFGLAYGDERRDQCLRVRRKFTELAALARSGARKFVFAHILAPHPPYVLTRGGACKSLAEADAQSRRDNYIDQVVYVNRAILGLVDAILAGPRPAVVIVQADEGPWPSPHIGDERQVGRDPVEVDWPRLSPEQLREKMGILYAVRVPASPRPDIGRTPVNLYRGLFAKYFDMPLAPLPDRGYVFAGDDDVYRFVDVTDAVLRPDPGSRSE